MTEIHCEFCGPTRIAPHDVNCPNTEVVRKGSVIGWVGESKPYTHPLLDPNFLMDFPATVAAMQPPPPPITVETNPEMFGPIVSKATDHYTVSGRRGAECYCGYNPAIEHPEAGRGQLFAYVGQHIKNESGI